MEESGPYTLELTEGDRPWVISNAQGREVFTFKQRDKRHVEEILKNLNTGVPPDDRFRRLGTT